MPSELTAAAADVVREQMSRRLGCRSGLLGLRSVALSGEGGKPPLSCKCSPVDHVSEAFSSLVCNAGGRSKAGVAQVCL